MFDSRTTELLRAVLEDVCRGVSRYESGTRTHVAVSILQAARQGETNPDSLKQIGRKALGEAPIWMSAGIASNRRFAPAGDQGVRASHTPD